MIIRREHILTVQTNDFEKYKELNTFFCKGYNASISPENCYYRRKYLEKTNNLKYTKCANCENNLEEDFLNVFIKRIKYNAPEITDNYIQNNIENIKRMINYYLGNIVKFSDKMEDKQKKEEKKNEIKKEIEKVKKKDKEEIKTKKIGEEDKIIKEKLQKKEELEQKYNVEDEEFYITIEMKIKFDKNILKLLNQIKKGDKDD